MEKTEGNKLTIDRVIPEDLFCQSPPNPGHLFSSIVQLNDINSEDFSKGFPEIGQSLHSSLSGAKSDTFRLQQYLDRRTTERDETKEDL
jgi:hypothetical protein